MVLLTAIRGKLDAAKACSVVWLPPVRARFETPVTTTGAENVAPWLVERTKWISAGDGEVPVPDRPAVRHVMFSAPSGPTTADAASTVRNNGGLA